MDFELLREWVKAEIEFANTVRERDEEGYMQSAKKEEKEADRLFNLLIGGKNGNSD